MRQESSATMAGMTARMKGRDRQVQRLILDVTDWARREDDVGALALVGSYARKSARMASDVDLVIVSAHFEQLAEDLSWFARLRPGSKLIHLQAWGPLLERRFRLRSGLHVELGLVSPAWTELPLDPGTRRVLNGGHVVLFDRHRLLSRAAKALRTRFRVTTGLRMKRSRQFLDTKAASAEGAEGIRNPTVRDPTAKAQ